MSNWLENRIEPDRFVYHVSLCSNRESILEKGLVPCAFERSNWSKSSGLGKYPPMVFASNTTIFHHLFYCDEVDMGPINTESIDFWEIDTWGSDAVWYYDMNNWKSSDYVCTPDAIPSDCLKLLKVRYGVCKLCGHLDYGKVVSQVLSSDIRAVVQTQINSCCFEEFALMDQSMRDHIAEQQVDQFGRYRMR